MKLFKNVRFCRGCCWGIILLGCGDVSFAQNSSIEEFEREIEGLEDRERIEFIADYIRNVSLYEVPYEPLKPYLEDIYEWEAQNPDPVLLNTLRLGSVNVSIAEGEKLEAVRYLTEILNSGVELAPKDSFSTYDFLHELYLEANAYSEAWNALHILDRVFINHSESSPFIRGFQFMKPGIFAAAYFELGDMHNAIEQFRLQIEVANEIGNLHREAGTYNNLGLAWLEVNEPDSAIEAFNDAKSVWERYLETRESVIRNDLFFPEVVNGNIGYAYNQKGLYVQAIPLLKSEMQVHSFNRNYHSMANALNELSRSYFGLNDFEMSLSLLDSASILLEEFPGHTSGIINNMEYKISVLQELDQYEEAYYTYKQLIAYQDSIAVIQDKERLDVLQVVYEVEQKNREIQEQELRALTAESIAQDRRVRSRFLFTGLIVSLMVVAFYIVLATQRKRKNNKIAEKNSIIEQSLQEKEMLLKEIHHRVKNNLQVISSLLSLQSDTLEDDASIQAIENSQQRVMSMSLVHESLYQTEEIKEIDVKEYIPRLYEYLSGIFGINKNGVEVQYALPSIKLDTKRAIPFGLMLNEVITNAFKYAFIPEKKGVLTFTAEVQEQHMTLTISDNGPGFEESDYDHSGTESLGMQLIDDMAHQLKARKKLTMNGGSTYEFTIPLES